MIRELVPSYVSIAMREMVRSSVEWGEAQEFYEWAQASNVEIQHILYTPAEIQEFVAALAQARIPGRTHLVQLVQGSYAHGSTGQLPLADYLVELEKAEDMEIDWMLCAFGQEETNNLAAAARLGGKVRVGFENSIWNADGSIAKDNAMRVREVSLAIQNAD